MPAITSPQAQIPTFRPMDELIKAQVVNQPLSILPAQLFTGTSEEVFPAEANVAIRVLTNCGTNAVKVCVGDVATTDLFHFILAGGSADDDGLGSVVDLSRYTGKVTVYSAAAHRLATFLAYAPEKGYGL
tara:strand:+ start:1053 stop:1442 length:390 start_codon:yes stop_codon:yes gene_type:complete